MTSSPNISHNLICFSPSPFLTVSEGQLELLQQGWPFVMFGDGTMCKCNPIAEYVRTLHHPPIPQLILYRAQCLDRSHKLQCMINILTSFLTSDLSAIFSLSNDC